MRRAPPGWRGRCESEAGEALAHRHALEERLEVEKRSRKAAQAAVALLQSTLNATPRKRPEGHGEQAQRAGQKAQPQPEGAVGDGTAPEDAPLPAGEPPPLAPEAAMLLPTSEVEIIAAMAAEAALAHAARREGEHPSSEAQQDRPEGVSGPIPPPPQLLQHLQQMQAQVQHAQQSQAAQAAQAQQAMQLRALAEQRLSEERHGRLQATGGEPLKLCVAQSPHGGWLR